MPATIPSARYDMAWKAAITHAFRPFLTFFFPELGARIDWSRRPRFRDKELAAIGFGDAASGLVADMQVTCWISRSAPPSCWTMPTAKMN